MAIAVVTSFQQLLDNNGAVLNGGSVTVYESNTTTPLDLFTDTGLSISAMNPIPLNSAGRHQVGMVYIDQVSYKILVKKSDGSTLYTLDNIDPGVAAGFGTLPVAYGGTGASTPGVARSNLDVPSNAEVSDLASSVSTIESYFGVDFTPIANGTTAQRPGSPLDGFLRFNTTLGKYEGYISSWRNFFTTQDVATQADQETATSLATVVTPGALHFHPGVAKCWCKIKWTGGVPALAASYGIASIADNSVGDVTVTFSTVFSSINYSVGHTVHHNAIATVRISSQLTNAIRFIISDSGGSGVDPVDSLSVQFFGDL